MTNQRPDTFLLRGGVDLATPSLAVGSGRARAAVNYEATERGYRRRAGMERFDGSPAPSRATFDMLRYRDRTNGGVVGQTVTGAESGANGRLLAAVPDPLIPGQPGVLASSTTALASSTTIFASSAPTEDYDPLTGYLVVGDPSGVFGSNEPILIGGNPAGISAGAATRGQGPTVDLTGDYHLLAANARRALINPVPGSGPVRGLAVLGDQLYAWRNDAEGTYCPMYRATPDGWDYVRLGYTIDFTGGTVEFQVGGALRQGGTSAHIRRVVLRSGTWDEGTAAGSITISGATSDFTAGNTTSAAGVGQAQLVGPQVPIEVPALTGSDVVRSTVHDFGDGERLYYATGVAPAMEFDGIYTTPIVSPDANVTGHPSIVAAFSNHLFLFFNRGTSIFSNLGDPVAFDAAAGGAGEIKLGSVPRDVIESAGTTLMIVCRTKIVYLVGTDATNFVLKELSRESGGWAQSAQNIGRPVYLDQLGLRELSPDNTLAGFSMGTMSRDVAPIFSSYEAAGTIPNCSVRCRTKDQYRAFFSDKTAVVAYFGNNPTAPEFTVFTLPVAMSCAVSDAPNDAEIYSGSERMFAGGVDGMVYHLDQGLSDDGADIESIIRLPFNPTGSPERVKRYHSYDLDVDAKGRCKISVSFEFDGADGERLPSQELPDVISGSGGYWGEAQWSEFIWSGPILTTVHGRIDGIGQSLSMLVLANSATEAPHVLPSCRINWTPRRYRR